MLYFMEFGNPLQDSCDLLGCHFGMTAPAHAHGALRLAQIHDLEASKVGDYLTGVLLQYCAAAKHIDAVALKIYRSEDSGEPYVTYILKDVLIATVRVGRMGQADQFGLDYKTITVTRLAG